MNIKLSLQSLIVLLLLSGICVAGQVDPTADLKPVLSDLTELLADDSLKGDKHLAERRQKIMKQIKRGFDFREMSRLVIGKKWRELAENDRDYFTQLMTKLLENVYVGKLEGYSGQTVEYVGQAVKGKKAQVSTVLTDGDLKIPVHYIMRLKESRWMVYDINIEGVSLIRNYRQQFKSILRKDQFEGLVKVLEEKNRSFEVENL